MKTKILIQSIAAGLLLSIASCTGLTEEVFDQLDGDKYMENLSDRDIASLLAPIYGDMRSLYAGWDAHKEGNWFYTGEETADIQITPKRGGAWYDGGIFERLNQHVWLVDDELVLGPWRSFYAGVNTCNRLLFQFSDTTQIKDESIRNSVLAEIRVARAFWYYNLIDFYGNVPLVTSYDVPEGYLPETEKRNSVFRFTVNELEQSIPNLPGEGYARWNKFAAKHLLARVYLNSEVWTGEAKWDSVISICTDIMNNGPYMLEPDYKASFITDNETSREIVFAIPNDEKYHAEVPFLPHLWSFHWKTYSHLRTETKYWGGMCGDPVFISTYDPEDLRLGKSWLMGQQYDNFGDFGKKGDPLLCEGWRPADAGLPLNYQNQITWTADGAGEQDGYRMFKYEVKVGAKPCLSNDFVLFRYADVYFMRAEALWRKNNKTATTLVVNLLNAVRERAFTNFSTKRLKTADLTEDRFLLEYGWEFCQEGHRRQQLIRFGQYTTKKWTFHNSSEPFRVLFPVPYKERIANPNLKQNEGY